MPRVTKDMYNVRIALFVAIIVLLVEFYMWVAKYILIQKLNLDEFNANVWTYIFGIFVLIYFLNKTFRKRVLKKGG
jgi:hypothetical protein